MAVTRHDERSLGELAHELGAEAATLVRQEVELAKAELAEKASHAAKGAGMFGAVAGALALFGKKQVKEAVPPVPEQTIESVKEDIQTVKHARDGGRTPVGANGRSAS